MKIFILPIALMLAACSAQAERPAPKPVSQMTPPERCRAMGDLLGNPHLTMHQKDAMLERMRNEGCMGRPQ